MASGGAPGVGRSTLLPSTGEVVVPTADGLIVSADRGESWRRLDCSRAGILGNCATVAQMALRGSNLHNNISVLEGYVVLPHTINETAEKAIMVKKYTSVDGIKWEQLSQLPVRINASQLEAAVCTVRTQRNACSRLHP